MDCGSPWNGELNEIGFLHFGFYNSRLVIIVYVFEESEAELIVSKLRLPLINLSDLINVVRPSGLISADSILDAIKEQQERKSVELMSRGFLRKFASATFSTILQFLSVLRCEDFGLLFESVVFMAIDIRFSTVYSALSLCEYFV